MGRRPSVAAIPAGLTCLLALSPLHAQAEESTLSLPAIEVKGEATGGKGNVLPASPSSEALFGTNRSLVDIPRQSTFVSEELLESATIEEIRDLTRVSGNTYSPNNFGNASLPTIRGDLGEIFQNGMRRIGGNNGFGFPTSFNSVEAIDVVKGPPTVPLGPTQRVGGYINLVSKKPYLDRFRGQASVTTGGFKDRTPFDRKRFRVDVGGPIEQGTLGYRFSAEVVRDDEFFDFAETESENLYLALAMEPSVNTRVDFSLEYFNVDKFPDIAGFNRPTQELIDSGRIITGTDPSATSGFPGLDAVINGGAVISPTGTQKIDRDRVLNHPGDRAEADHLLVNLTIEQRINEALTFTNRTMFQDLSKEAVETNSFVEIIDTDISFQNRSEIAAEFSTRLAGLKWDHYTVFGLDLRYQNVEGFSQFTTEADNPIDLTAPIDTRIIPINDLSIQTPELQAIRDQLVFLESEGVFVSPGANYDLDGDGVGDFRLSDTTDSSAYQAGLFVQEDLTLSDRWSLLVGARGDLYHVEARDGAPPKAVLERGLPVADDSITEINPTVNASLNFRPTANSSLYFTYNFTKATINTLGGGFGLGPDNEIPEEDFDTDSQLFEVGGKIWLLDQTLWASSALFRQTRNLRNRDGSVSGIISEGAELEFSYQPNRRLFATVNASLLESRFDDAVAFQGTEVVADAFDNSRPDIIQGTGDGSPGFTVFGPTDRRVPGLPQFLLNGFAQYQMPSGFGGHFGGVYHDSFRLDFRNRVRIPDQFTLNGGLFYKQPDWEFRVDVFNLTDEENFTTNFNGFFGSTLAFPEEPIRYLATLTYKL